MNTHIARWKIQFDDVQKVIDAMPESHDHTAEAQAEGKRSKTVSEKSSQEDEENKGEEDPWADQELMNMNEPTMIPEIKVNSGSKAGTTKPPLKSEPKDLPLVAMITPNPQREEPTTKGEKE